MTMFIDLSQITRQPTAPPAAAASAVAQVKADADGLRLRKAPSISGDIITKLPASTPLTVTSSVAGVQTTYAW